jgi:hypothetical protein
MDQRYRRIGFDVRVVRLQPWKLWLLAAVGGALAVALAIAVAGLFLVLVPLFLLGGLVAKLVLGGASRPATRPPGTPEVIEGHYEVLDRPKWRDRGEDLFPDRR